MKGTVGFFALLLVCSIPFYSLYSHSNSTFIFGNLAQLAGLAFAFRSYMNLSSTFSRSDPLRNAANLLTLGMFIWILGQALEMYCELILNLIAYGTIADAIWVVGYFPMIAGLHTIWKVQWKAQYTGQWKSLRPLILISAAGYAILFWFLIWPQLLEKDQRASESILDFLYPTLDFILMVQCALIAWISKRDSNFFAFAVVTAIAMILTLIGDGVISLVKDFHSLAYLTVDIYYYSCYFLIAFAADLATTRRTSLVLNP